MSIFTPWFLVLLPIVFLLFYNLQENYRRTTRELKRFDSTSRSPIYTNFSSSLSGLSSIHAFSQFHTWTANHHAASDNNFRFGYLVLTASRWSSVRFEFMSHCMILFVSLYISFNPDLSPGLAGAALMNITLISRTLMNAVRNYVQLELGFNAVERIEYYTTSLPQEDSKESPALINTSEWPSKGTIEFLNYSVSYRPGLPLVLNDMTVTIEGGSKVGIVGRTGSGKSTLALALFRMIEKKSGSCKIDGVQIAGESLVSEFLYLCSCFHQQP